MRCMSVLTLMGSMSAQAQSTVTPDVTIWKQSGLKIACGHANLYRDAPHQGAGRFLGPFTTSLSTPEYDITVYLDESIFDGCVGEYFACTDSNVVDVAAHSLPFYSLHPQTHQYYNIGGGINQARYGNSCPVTSPNFKPELCGRELGHHSVEPANARIHNWGHLGWGFGHHPRHFGSIFIR
ncbi:hypothetical protein B0H34DRAFT_669728 [Crassisporium funariophilum]|nr:hypothetical protein B0H34DRAFT_669728 [Crassisporium funariophilum]